MSNKFDPLEEAKIEAPRARGASGIGAAASVTPRVAAPAPVVESPRPQSPVSGVVASVVIQPPANFAGSTRFRVLKSKAISWYGQMTTVPAGSIIDHSGYGGALGIARLVEQGVELEPIE